jgi:hypothetical protein
VTLGKFLKIKEWEKYQHYKDRNPPWIKLHRELLTSYTWTALDDSDRLLAIVCMILAADTDNKIPLDRDFIKRRAQLRGRPDVRNLVEVGFAEIIDEQGCSTMPQDASNSAQSVQNVRPETEAETELPISKKRARRLPEDFIPKPEHYTLGHELRVIVDTEFQVFRDHFLGTGAAKIDWDATLRNWLRRSVKFGGSNGASRQVLKQSAILKRSGRTETLQTRDEPGLPNWVGIALLMAQDKRHDLMPGMSEYWKAKLTNYSDAEVSEALQSYRGEYFPSVDAVIGLIEVQRDSRKVQDYQPIDRKAVEAEQSTPEWDESAERARSALRKLAGRMA